MELTFLGATKTVTGSNFLLEAAGKKILIDCGLYQGKAIDELENYEDFAFNPSEIDCLLLTHAHIDHSGRIPKLYISGFNSPIIATKATTELCGIMLPDSRTHSRNGNRVEKQKESKKRIRTIRTTLYCTRCNRLFKAI